MKDSDSVNNTSNNASSVGIDSIALASGSLVLSLDKMARFHSIDPEKYHKGLGQKQMSVCNPDEDIITMAFNAANRLYRQSPDSFKAIRTVIFATESGVDQSKSAGLWIKNQLNLPSNCRFIEFKQACYSATAALRFAYNQVKISPKEKVLILASDIARYDLDSVAEPTQGCGAIAMLISSNPKIAKLRNCSGIYSEDVMDFWRPNYRCNALVDGKFSTKVYLRGLKAAFNDYLSHGGYAIEAFKGFCFHTPFTRMAQKALETLKGSSSSFDDLTLALEYNRQLGNCYSASLYINLLGFLERVSCKAGDKIALFSYGSGAVSEFFDIELVNGFTHYLFKDEHEEALTSRTSIEYEEFRRIHSLSLPTDGRHYATPQSTKTGCRLKGLYDHQRQYEVLS